jgi:hypothetical protein
MSLRTAMLNVIDQVTNVLLPELPSGAPGLDQVPSQLTIRTRTWSGGAIGLGTTSDSDLVLPKKYFIRQVTTREIANSGGRYEAGDLVMEGIVPNDVANPGVGFTESQLVPTVTAEGTEIIYFVTGQHSGEYERGYVDTAATYEYKLFLTRRRTTPLVAP